MKVFKKVIFIVIFMLATLANYANKNNFYNTKNSENITFVFKGTKKGHQLKVKDQNGEVLYSEEIKRKGNITKSFNFNNLKDGSYTLELEKDFEIIVKSIKIERNKVVIEKAENIIFKPVIRLESDKLMISKITFDKKPLEIALFFKGEIIYSETIKGGPIVNRIYKLDLKAKGDYEIVIENNGRTYNEIFKL